MQLLHCRRSPQYFSPRSSRSTIVDDHDFPFPLGGGMPSAVSSPCDDVKCLCRPSRNGGTPSRTTAACSGFWSVPHPAGKTRRYYHIRTPHRAPSSAAAPTPDALRDFAALLLRYACHYGKPKFTVILAGVDMISNEYNTDSLAAQQPRVRERVNRISGKA